MMHDDVTRRDHLPAGWTDRYLALLGIEREAPRRAALARLVRAHVLRVPFENVTAHRRRRDNPTGPAPEPDRSALLDAWERRAGGGVCFDITTMVLPLLRALGYDARLILAHISGPYGHQGIVVHVGGERLLVDLGTGAPFFAPIPLTGVHEVHEHGLAFRFRALDANKGDDSPEWLRERLVDGTWVTACRYDLGEAREENRQAGYQKHLTPGATWVLGTLTMTRSGPDGVFALRDDALSINGPDGHRTVTVADDPAEYRRLASEVFSLPNLPIDDGRAILVRHRQGLSASDLGPAPSG